MTFSEKLIRLRKREGLSQEALAEMLGVSRQAVSRWEQGTALPDGGKLLPCARQFGVSVDWLLDEGQGWEAQRSKAKGMTVHQQARCWGPDFLCCWNFWSWARPRTFMLARMERNSSVLLPLCGITMWSGCRSWAAYWCCWGRRDWSG